MTAPDDAPEDPFKVNSLVATAKADPSDAEVHWDPPRSFWNGGMMTVALALCPFTFSWDALLVFLGTSALVLCTGHSVGFHRRLIHLALKQLGLAWNIQTPEILPARPGLTRVAYGTGGAPSRPNPGQPPRAA